MKPQDSAYFRFTDVTKKYFVIHLTDKEKITHVRRILSGKETGATQLSGTIIKETADYNSGWSYHFEPSSINFFDVSIEVCDANMEYLEEKIADAGGSFLPSCTWCPWTAVFVDEVNI